MALALTLTLALALALGSTPNQVEGVAKIDAIVGSERAGMGRALPELRAAVVEVRGPTLTPNTDPTDQPQPSLALALASSPTQA